MKNKMYLRKSFILIFVCFTTIFLHAVPSGFAYENAYFFRGVRPLGMGGAFTAIADDENALFYNPAGLAAIEESRIVLLNPVIEISKKGIDLLKDLRDTDMDDTGEVADLLREYVGDHQHARISLFPHITIPLPKGGVIVGAFGQTVLDASIRNPVWPNVHVTETTDLGLVGGVGLEVPIVGLRAGIGLKMIHRSSLDEIYTPTEIASLEFDDIIDDDVYKGSGISLDLGLICPLGFIPFFDTNIGLSVQNFPEMNMGDAIDVKTKVNTGIALSKSIGGFTVTGAYDYHDLTNAYDDDNDKTKNSHLGLEVRFPTIISARIGSNQGYFTAGATLDFGKFRLDVATYGEELGFYGGQDEDRRYVGQMTFGW